MSRLLCTWYSRTGTGLHLAGLAAAALRELGHEVCEAPLLPRFDLPYPLWLALSFVPGSRAPLAPPVPDPKGFDGCVLVSPKWTLSCPPVNSFLAGRGRRLPPTALLLVYGGWDQDRYLGALAARMRRRGVPVSGTLSVKRNLVYEKETPLHLRDFLAGVFPSSHSDQS